jgi:uncharacterized membrane protein
MWGPVGCSPLLFFLFIIFLFPLILADVMATALGRLGLSPETSLLVVLGIFLGGAVNIPVKRIPRDQELEVAPFRVFGLNRFFPRAERRRKYTIIAVNLGGCVIPVMLAVYELMRLASASSSAFLFGLGGVALNVFVCYRTARPVQGLGIAMPALIPALIAALYAMLAGYEFAPQVAFVSGVLGPLIGADLLHLRDISRLSTGIASIGGAGTFDGIVISGLVATLLA